jgi:hypothetical protein
MCVIQVWGQRECKVRAHKDVFGIATVYTVSGENRLVAKILHAVMAVPAIAIDAAHPGNADTPGSSTSLANDAQTLSL